MLTVSGADNTAIVWGLFDALRRGDLERVLGYCDPDVEFESLTS
jgi:ketosteroid isomerase-like protein